MSVRITNIQHFCLHDGPGIRTTVFLKGCNLKCPWCCNPENIDFEIQNCFGRDISLNDLEKELLKDELYYSVNDGGVTFSGGEPLLQIKELVDLLKSLNSKKINICFETALFTNQSLLEMAIPYVDEFIVDVKILNKQLCSDIIGGDVNLFLNNLKLLFDETKQVILRFPISDFTLMENNVDLILKLFDRFKPHKVEIFKIHDLAKDKYKKLDKSFYYSEIDDVVVEDILNKFKQKLENVEIIKF